MGQPAVGATAARHRAGLGARLPCDECEPWYKRFVSELALQRPLRLPAQPDPASWTPTPWARLEPAVSRAECPVCGARRHQRCRNLAFPQHFAPTYPERGSGP
jgi:hypothetical protein